MTDRLFASVVSRVSQVECADNHVCDVLISLDFRVYATVEWEVVADVVDDATCIWFGGGGEMDGQTCVHLRRLMKPQ